MSVYKPLESARDDHTISELCKVCGVTRRMILNYEAHGLITPVSVNEESGYRYYGATSAARICHIKGLQSKGLSLDNIARFTRGDETVLHEHLSDLEERRRTIEAQILHTKALLTEKGDFTVHREMLSACDCIVITEPYRDSQHNFWLLWRITSEVFAKGYQVSPTSGGLFSIRYLDPNSENYGAISAVWALHKPNSETVHFPATEALCVNMKGPYDQLPQVVQVLMAYAAEHRIAHSGQFRIRYLASPQSHADPENYVTQVFLPIE